MSERDLVPLAALVCGEISAARDRPRVFKTTGMGWEDLVVATAEFESGRTSRVESPPKKKE